MFDLEDGVGGTVLCRIWTYGSRVEAPKYRNFRQDLPEETLNEDNAIK
jgi:hypothetical protein